MSNACFIFVPLIIYTESHASRTSPPEAFLFSVCSRAAHLSNRATKSLLSSSEALTVEEEEVGGGCRPRRLLQRSLSRRRRRCCCCACVCACACAGTGDAASSLRYSVSMERSTSTLRLFCSYVASCRCRAPSSVYLYIYTPLKAYPAICGDALYSTPVDITSTPNTLILYRCVCYVLYISASTRPAMSYLAWHNP